MCYRPPVKLYVTGWASQQYLGHFRVPCRSDWAISNGPYGSRTSWRHSKNRPPVYANFDKHELIWCAATVYPPTAGMPIAGWSETTNLAECPPPPGTKLWEGQRHSREPLERLPRKLTKKNDQYDFTQALKMGYFKPLSWRQLSILSFLLKYGSAWI